MLRFLEPMEQINEAEGGLDSQFWHACAGGMVQIPPLNSEVYYFPQGHAEHACEKVEFKNIVQIRPFTACRVSSIKYMADHDTDEVYAKIGLIPIDSNDDDVTRGDNEYVSEPKLSSFAKTLTRSDANNGGGFSVPRYCAETLFPPLDYTATPPVQTITAKDVHGKTWSFRHIYRGTPRRHLLTTGWSTFVNNKSLVSGDSILFFRAGNGELCIGIRRSRRGIEGGRNGKFATFSGSLREDASKIGGNCYAGNTKVTAESVIEAAYGAATGQAFEVVYYPRVNTADFFVRASVVSTALRVCWAEGLRFKMAFSAEDCSRISWLLGTIVSIQLADPHWPDSPWRLLQVIWDEPDLVHNIKRVSPWAVELVTNLPAPDFSPFSKRRRLLDPPECSYGNPGGSFFGCFHPTTPAGMQGARHSELLLPTLPRSVRPIFNSKEAASCSLTIGNSSEKEECTKATQFKLFGQIIVTEELTDKTSNGSDESELQETDGLATTVDVTLIQAYEGLDESLRRMFE